MGTWSVLDRGVGTAAAMAAAHSRLEKRVKQLYSINAHAQVMIFELVRTIWTWPVFQGQYFKRYNKLSTMTQDAMVYKVSSCFFFFLW